MTYTTIREHLLYNDVIEGDGRVSHEPTLIGIALLTIGAGIALVAAWYVIALFFSIL